MYFKKKNKLREVQEILGKTVNLKSHKIDCKIIST